MARQRSRARRRTETAPTNGVVRVRVTNDGLSGSDSDWYTPKIFQLLPKVVAVSVGREGKNQISCEIHEGEWEHPDVYLSFKMDDVKGAKYELGVGAFYGQTNAEQIDQIISVLVRARDEAAKLGLFTRRPAPTLRDAAKVFAGDAIKGSAR